MSKLLTVPKIRALKGKKKIVMLTAYEYLTASYLASSGVDIILVGDTLGMVFAGRKDTLPVTVDEVIYHAKAVKRGAAGLPVIVDMPFLSYQVSPAQAKKSAGRIMKETGAVGVKLEGGEEVISQVRAITGIGIPVMGHLGIQPQSVNKYGGYPVYGKTSAESEKLIKDAVLLEEAGAFSIVLEKVKADVARRLVKAVKIPVIGIGSGPWCDGQVLVTHDLIGAFEDFKPAFVKRYANTAPVIKNAVKKFAADVRKKKYPSKKFYF